MTRTVRIALVIALVAAATSAAGEEVGERVRLDYQAPNTCPDQAAFEARALLRTSRLRFVTEGESHRFHVAIRAGRPLTGRLVVRRGDSVEGEREVHAETCDALADALALMVDLAVDPTALVAAPTVALAATASAPAETPGAPAASQEPPAPAPSAINAPPPAPPGLAPLPPEPDRRAATHAPSRTLYLGADLALATGTLPHALLGPVPYAGWRAGGEGIVDLGVRLGFMYGTSGALDTANGSASFTWTVGRVDGCLLAWPRGSLHLTACARLEAGALEGIGGRIPEAQSQTRGWLATGPLVRVEWAPIGTLFFDADVAPMLHVTNDRFYFAPNATVYTVPFAGMEAAAGLGVHFL